MMIELEHYFYDSYALIELIKGNENYLFYSDKPILMTKLNLFEVYQALIRAFGEAYADPFLIKYKDAIIDYDEHIIKSAAKMRIEFKKKRLSMTDCIGYCLAKQKGLKFLTGNQQFKDMENVEFVK